MVGRAGAEGVVSRCRAVVVVWALRTGDLHVCRRQDSKVARRREADRQGIADHSVRTDDSENCSSIALSTPVIRNRAGGKCIAPLHVLERVGVAGVQNQLELPKAAVTSGSP